MASNYSWCQSETKCLLLTEYVIKLSEYSHENNPESLVYIYSKAVQNMLKIQFSQKKVTKQGEIRIYAI